MRDGQIVTNGGRVLGVTALGRDLQAAQTAACTDTMLGLTPEGTDVPLVQPPPASTVRPVASRRPSSARSHSRLTTATQVGSPAFH